ncbi:MAG TPA: hypothetical protein IAB45_06490 [Candidatus Onthousia faecavium]|nr:hypothetical protein [Candidatus Onthousia faecavium]
MISIEELKQNELYSLNNAKKIWESDHRGLDNIHVKRELENIANKLTNFDEYIKEVVARNAVVAQDTIASVGFSNFVKGATNFLEIKEDDPISSELHLQDIETYGSALAIGDNLVQKIYESYGFTDMLPTKKDIRLLEGEYASLNTNDINYISQSNELEREIVLAKKHRGENTQYFRTDAQVNAVFDNRNLALGQNRKSL